MATISLVIRTYNAMSYWPDLMRRIREQSLVPDELLIVDSESTDDTLKAAKQAGARTVQLLQKEFTHAKSTNLGFQEARGEWVAMLSQDSLPGTSQWLENLVKPLGETSVAAAFGRQTPRPHCFPLEAWELGRSFPSGNTPKVLYSNVNSVAKKSLWEKTPFDESVNIAEDRMWALRLIAQGYRVVYEPGAVVIHSHDYTLKQMYERCRREARACRDQEGITHGLGLLTKAWPKRSVLDGVRLAREGKFYLWPRAVAYRLAQFAGMVAGGSS